MASKKSVSWKDEKTEERIPAPWSTSAWSNQKGAKATFADVLKGVKSHDVSEASARDLRPPPGFENEPRNLRPVGVLTEHRTIPVDALTGLDLGVEEEPGADASKKDKEEISSYLKEIYNVQQESIDGYESYLVDDEEMQKEDSDALKKKLWFRMDRHSSVHKSFSPIEFVPEIHRRNYENLASLFEQRYPKIQSPSLPPIKIKDSIYDFYYELLPGTHLSKEFLDTAERLFEPIGAFSPAGSYDEDGKLGYIHVRRTIPTTPIYTPRPHVVATHMPEIVTKQQPCPDYHHYNQAPPMTPMQGPIQKGANLYMMPCNGSRVPFHLKRTALPERAYPHGFAPNMLPMHFSDYRDYYRGHPIIQMNRPIQSGAVNVMFMVRPDGSRMPFNPATNQMIYF